MPEVTLQDVQQAMNPSLWRSLLEHVLLYLPQLATGVILFLVFWIVGLGVQRLIVRLCRTARVDEDLALLLGRIAKIALLAIGAMTALGTLGVDVRALIAGLGLTGFALGFALKDIISNALSGILVILYEPFKRHDEIVVTGFEGTVVEINLRYTVLESAGKRTFIPNANLFSNPVVVKTRAAAAADAKPPLPEAGTPPGTGTA